VGKSRRYWSINSSSCFYFQFLLTFESWVMTCVPFTVLSILYDIWGEGTAFPCIPCHFNLFIMPLPRQLCNHSRLFICFSQSPITRITRASGCKNSGAIIAARVVCIVVVVFSALSLFLWTVGICVPYLSTFTGHVSRISWGLQPCSREWTVWCSDSYPLFNHNRKKSRLSAWLGWLSSLLSVEVEKIYFY